MKSFVVVLMIVAAAFAASTPTPDSASGCSGVWQALNTANWDLQAHGAEPGPDPYIGAKGDDGKVVNWMIECETRTPCSGAA
jgi:hypothetical protein